MGNLFAFGDKVIGDGESSQGSGHVIQDSSGTAMTPQPNLQFADAKVTNDSQGQATKIQNFVDIDWDDWQEVDDNDDTYYRVTDAPLVDGNVEVDLMKKLWENPAPTASFVAQTITLNSADYDFLLVVYEISTSTHYMHSVITPKGEDIWLSISSNSNGGAISGKRGGTCTSDTVIAFEDATIATGTTASTTNNSTTIPIAIYGIKQKVTISLSAIISNVSTSADHCFLSDDVTDVETKFDEMETVEDVSSYFSTSIANVTFTAKKIGKVIQLKISAPSTVTITSGNHPALFTASDRVKPLIDTPLTFSPVSSVGDTAKFGQSVFTTTGNINLWVINSIGGFELACTYIIA